MAASAFNRHLRPQPMPLRGSSCDSIDLESADSLVRSSTGAASSQEVEILTVSSSIAHGAALAGALRGQFSGFRSVSGRSRSRSPRFAPFRPPRRWAVASSDSDAELAAALQLEEATAAGLKGRFDRNAANSSRPLHPEGSPPGREYLYIVEPGSGAIRCCGCHARINPREPQVLFQRATQSRPLSAHVGCLSGIGGLVRPVRLPGGEDSGEVMMSAVFQPDERAAIEGQLAELLAGPSEGGVPGELCHFEWPVRARPPVPAAVAAVGAVAAAVARPLRQLRQLLLPRPPVAAAVAGSLHAAGGSGMGDLQRRVASADRDFNAEDYEMLLQLDERPPGPRSSQDELQVTMMLSQMPVRKLAATSAGTQCSICLEKMDVGDEVRTLPCLHFFHRVCIDKWISTPGAPAKCPIDQAEIDPAR